MPLEPIATTLEKTFELTPTVRTFRLRFPEDKWIPFKAGQFCMVHVPGPPRTGEAGCFGSDRGANPDSPPNTPHRVGIPEKSRDISKESRPIKKAYSICSAPSETGYLDLCIKLVEGGHATNWFWSLQEGEKITVTLPYGGFVLKEPVQDELIFIATGTGLAPLRSMIKTLLEKGHIRPMTLIFGVRYENEIFYESEFREWEKKHSNFKFIPTISRPKDWKGETGYVQNQLRKLVTDPKGKQIYVCGLVPMIEAVQKAAEEIGFEKKQVHFEKYV